MRKKRISICIAFFIAFNLFAQDNTPKEKAENLLKLSVQTLQKPSDNALETALRYAEDAKNVYPIITDDDLWGCYSITKASVECYMGRLDTADYYADIAIEKHKSGRFYSDLCLAYYAKAKIVADRELFSKAIEMYEHAMSLCDENHKMIKLLSNFQIAKCLRVKGDIKGATEKLLSVIDESAKENQSYVLGQANGILAMIKSDQNEYEEAIRYNKSAYTAYEKISFQKGMCWTLKAIATCYFYWNKPLESKDYFQQSRECVSHFPTKDEVYIASIYKGLAMAYFNMNEMDSAFYYGNENLKIIEKMDYVTGKIEGYSFMGELFIKIKKYNKAVDVLQKALKLVCLHHHYKLFEKLEKS